MSECPACKSRTTPESAESLGAKLNAVVLQLLASAQEAFTTSEAPADIKQSADTLRGMLQEWQTYHERVQSTVIGLLHLVQARCAHHGAQQGSNERDGSWMAKCPTCGAVE